MTTPAPMPAKTEQKPTQDSSKNPATPAPANKDGSYSSDGKANPMAADKDKR